MVSMVGDDLILLMALKRLNKLFDGHIIYGYCPRGRLTNQHRTNTSTFKRSHLAEGQSPFISWAGKYISTTPQ